MENDLNEIYNSRGYSPKFTGYVDKDDVDNVELDLLPVRRVCSGGWCSCSGYCRNVIGHISREDYERWQANINLAEAFHNMTAIKIIT